MSAPFLISKSIYLRGLEEQDLEGNYINWFNDEQVCQNNSHHVFPYFREKAIAYINWSRNDKDALVLAIIMRGNNQHIGNVALQNIDYFSRSAEFAIVIGEKSCWGKGYSKESSLLIVTHGFMEMNLNRIYCGTSVDNIPMQRLAVSLGMKEEGRREEALYKHGKYVDIIEYGALKDGFSNKFNL